jgi:hypothetical protein
VSEIPVAHGSGWRVFRVGRSFCVQIDRDDAAPRELWMRRATDMARTSALASLVAEGLNAEAAREALEANWEPRRDSEVHHPVC